MAVESIDLDILKFMTERHNYELYKDVITKSLCTKESWTLVQDFGKYFAEYPNASEIDQDFELWFRVTGHPGWKTEEHQLYGNIIRNVLTRPAPARNVFSDQLERLTFETNARKALDDLSKGSITPSDMLATLQPKLVSTTADSGLVEVSLANLASNARAQGGLYWRCEDLNKSVGPIWDGDFAIIAKRPEVGGTSFLCSEMSFMVEQLAPNGKAILFNNEEAYDKVGPRMMSSALGVDYRTMMANQAQYDADYAAWLGNRTWDLYHDTAMDIRKIRRRLDEGDYDLIGINVLLKVGGTNHKEDHDKFQALGEEMRRIAQEFGPVLAIVQADPSAEGMRYIPQDRIYKSKTALQGEADVLIMIGSDDSGPPDSRYIHVAKNKIPPAPCCDLAVKHIKSEVRFDMGTGRFSSQFYNSHSRPKK